MLFKKDSCLMELRNEINHLCAINGNAYCVTSHISMRSLTLACNITFISCKTLLRLKFTNRF